MRTRRVPTFIGSNFDLISKIIVGLSNMIFRTTIKT